METCMYSIVEFYYNKEPVKRKCGYCKGVNGSQRDGMWAHTLTVQDYQNLIDRGWRRSGSYLYKPINDQSCCPLYTIRCDALNFIPSKSNKKIIKKMSKFLKNNNSKDLPKKSYATGEKIPHDIDICSQIESKFHEHIVIETSAKDINILKDIQVLADSDLDGKNLSEHSILDNPGSSGIGKIQNHTEKIDDNNVETGSHYKTKKLSNEIISDAIPGIKKAKFIRIERARKRLLSQGKNTDEIDEIYRKKKHANCAMSIDELLATVVSNNNNLELKLVRVSSEEFMETLDDSVALFEKYQMAIHNDTDECDRNAFLSFLGKSPLQHYAPKSGPPLGYGSFHQQYWLNNKLMAVGVIDILPNCISSVYFFYDPEYSFLSLGTYSSIMEVKLVRELNKITPDLKYYYMGFYIHNIPKMKYKAKMRPSSLLCPETYIWCDIDKCLLKLDKNKYSRFNEDPNALDDNGQLSLEELMKIKCYYRGKKFYEDVRAIRIITSSSIDDVHEVREYSRLVGKKCAHNIYLYLSQ